MTIKDTEKTPYQNGFDDAQAGKQCPPKPNGNSSWSEKLYDRGWTTGNLQGKAALKLEDGEQ